MIALIIGSPGVYWDGIDGNEIMNVGYWLAKLEFPVTGEVGLTTLVMPL